jgi:hypothetical protein
MTATMSKPTIETTLEGLVRLHYSNRGSDLAMSKKEVASEYWKRGIREGIAAILFQYRGDSLPRFKTIPMIYESDVNSILRDFEKDFVHGGPGDKLTALDVIHARLIELAVPADLIETDEEERRRLVLLGEEPTRESDHEWIGEAIAAKRKEMEELDALLKPMGNI